MPLCFVVSDSPRANALSHCLTQQTLGRDDCSLNKWLFTTWYFCNVVFKVNMWYQQGFIHTE